MRSGIEGSQGAAKLERCCGAALVILLKIMRVVQSTRRVSMEEVPLSTEVVQPVWEDISAGMSGNTSLAESVLGF